MSDTNANNRADTYLISVNNQQEVQYSPKLGTLLECLESKDIEVHYHCRDGFCGACRIKLNKGKINYPQGEPLAFVGKDEILPCCCIPISDIDVTIE